MSDEEWRSLAREGRLVKAAVVAERCGALVTVPAIQEYVLPCHADNGPEMGRRFGGSCVACNMRKLAMIRGLLRGSRILSRFRHRVASPSYSDRDELCGDQSTRWGLVRYP